MSNDRLLQQILEYVKEPKLQKNGKYRSWCPFHLDGEGKPPHEPDLYIDENGFRCFACNQHGSLFDLAKKLGIQRGQVINRLNAIDCLKGRGIRAETIEVFGIRQGNVGEALIPIRDENGQEMAIRIRTQQGKKLWPKKEKDDRRAFVLTDWKRVIATKMVLLVAGETDFLVTWQVGYPAATFLHGEGTVLEQAVDMIAKYVQNITVLYDADDMGAKGAESVYKAFEAKGMEVVIKQLPVPEPGIKDVCDLYKYVDFDDGKLRTILDTANVDRLSQKTRTSLSLMPLSELLLKPVKEINYVWEDILPKGGLSIVAAKPKVGKSTFARNLSLAIARGESFLGRITYQGAVIYLAAEEKEDEVARHFRNMGAGNEPIYIYVGMLPHEVLDKLKAEILRHNAEFTVVDPLLQLAKIKDINAYAEVYTILSPILNIARETNCHILTVHHENKRCQDGGDSILGSTALFGGVDTAIILRSGNEMRTIESIQRYGHNIPKTFISFDNDTGLLSLGEQVKEVEVLRSENKILDLLAEREMHEPEIKAEIGGDTGLIGKALRRLVEKGEVERKGQGIKGDPFIYRKILVSRLPYIEKQENEKNKNLATTPENTNTYVIPQIENRDVLEV